MYSVWRNSAPKRKANPATPGHRPAQHSDVFRRAKGCFAQRHEHVLHEDAAPRVQVRRVATEEAHEHDDAQRPLDARRQELRQGDGHAHLLLDGGLGDLADVTLDLCRLRGVVRVFQIGQRADGQQHDDRALAHLAPASEDATHARLVRVERGRVVAAGVLPGHSRVDTHGHAHEHILKVEVARRPGVEGVQHGLAGSTSGKNLRHVGPREGQHQRDDDEQIEHLGNHSLHTIADHHRQEPARHGQHQGDGQEHSHEHDVGRHRNPEGCHPLRYAQEVHEDAGAHRRDDAEVHDARAEGQHPRGEPKPSAVAQLKKLRERHGARFAEAVDDEAGYNHEQSRQRLEPAPPRQHETRVRDDLESSDKDHGTRLLLALGDGEQVTPGHASA